MNNDGNKSISDKFTQEQWMLMLFSFVTDLPIKEWNEFSHDLIYKNRFSSSHKVVYVIRNFAEKCANTIPKGTKLYRARIYYQNPFQEFVVGVFKNTALKKTADNTSSINDYFNLQLASMVMEVNKKTSRGEEIINAYKKWQRKRFKGYNATESGAPPNNKASSGRLNPDRIRCLYLSEDPNTAVYEVRPTIGQYVSVATFMVKDEMNIYDLTKVINVQEGDNSGDEIALFNVIQQRFSEPNTGDVYKYLPTQYLGEIIKQMGFDGIRFKSSLKRDGINIVLFDDKKCKAICSDLVNVGDISLDIVPSDIYQFEELLRLDMN